MRRSFRFSKERRAILKQELEKAGSPYEMIRPRKEGSNPLSFGQRRFWLLDRLNPGDSAYNVPAAVRMAGGLDYFALARSLEEIIVRHDVLRAYFPDAGGTPMQEFAPRWNTHALPLCDLSGLPVSRRQTEALTVATREGRRAFDLSTGPLFRSILWRIDATEHLMLVTAHHIVWDGWSTQVFVRELGELYGAFVRGLPMPLEDLPIQYVDFAAWQEQRLAGERLDAHLSYWREKLAGAPAEMLLPADRPRLTTRERRSGQVRTRLPSSAVRQLGGLAKLGGATLFMAFLAVFKELLSRLVGRDDILVGTPIAGRERREVGNLIGFFVNTLALRTNLSGNPSFEDVLVRVKDVCREAYAHQELAFDLLVEALQPDRLLNRNPIVQVIFAVEGDWNPTMSNLSTELIEISGSTAAFDLTLVVTDADGEWSVLAEYDADLFDTSTMERISGCYRSILLGVTEEPKRRLWEVKIQSPAVCHQILREWNATACPYRRDDRLHLLYERRTRHQPDAMAAACGHRYLSYGELDRRANRLARFLQQRDLATGSCIAIDMARSLEMIVALLGTLKSDLTYVPIEASWPFQRKRWILESLDVACVLTQHDRSKEVHDLVWRLPGFTDVVFLDVNSRNPLAEQLDTAAQRSLWDHVADTSVDRSTSGGFYSSYTGHPFTEAEVDEYRDRVIGLLEGHIDSSARVLEIGCGSGLVMYEIAPRVGRYVGVDPSESTQNTNREVVRGQSGICIELITAFAHELTFPEAEEFDVIILASVIQFFPGHIYLEETIRQLYDLLSPKGVLLIADVPDYRRIDEFRESLEVFRSTHSVDSSVNTKTTLDELYVDEDFFCDVACKFGMSADVAIHHRREGFDNELAYRFDLLIEKSKATDSAEVRQLPKKRLHTGGYVNTLPAVAPDLAPGVGGIAYIIFTSGSTGTPKGVVVAHGPVVNLIDWVNRRFAVTSSDRALFITALGFDLSVYDVFGILSAGGFIRIASDSDLREPTMLAEWLEKDRITFWDSAPAALQQLMPFVDASEGRKHLRSSLRLVFLSGDWIPVQLPDELRARFAGAKVVSLGGATEATVWSNFYPIAGIDPLWRSIPYGRPISNATYYILDLYLNPIPLGVTGDLYIGGTPLASCYVLEPRLSAKKFIPDRFGDIEGRRLYRTGDLARFLSDGSIEFLGRADHQVKVRGYRIELEEIESCLSRLSYVREAVVAVRGGLSTDGAEDRHLVAYVLASRDVIPSAEEIRRRLSASLPAYMVPSVFVFLDKLPLSPNGKVDRRALPEPEQEESTRYDAPRSAMEELLAGMFSELLKKDRVSAQDDFFRLGGHSLLATQLVSRIRGSCGVELPVRRVFEAPTVRDLARSIEEQKGVRRELDLPPIERVAPEKSLPLSFAQQRLWFLQQVNPHSVVYNIPLAVRLEGRLRVSALAPSLDAITERHEVLRTAFHSREGVPIQVIGSGAERGLIEVDLQGLEDTRKRLQAGMLVRQEAGLPFDLTQGPMLRTTLIRLATEENLLLVSMHHIAGDGWSIGVFMRELGELYGACCSSGTLTSRLEELPELRFRYADFASWQRGWMSGQVLAAELSFWKDHLRNAPPVLELYTDRPRPPLQTFRGARRVGVFPRGFHSELRTLSRKHGATPFMVLLAAFKALLSRYTGQADIVVGTPVAGRNHTETENMIGLFINTLVLRTAAGRTAKIGELLRQVRERTIEVLMHQDLPFEALVEELAVERDLSHSPLFQVLFSMQNVPMEPLEMAEMRLEPLAASSGTSKFDLSVNVFEVNGELQEEWEFNVDLFDATTIERMRRHFRPMIAALSLEPQRRIDEIELLGPAELAQVLQDWNDTVRVWSEDCDLVHGLFEKQVDRRADSVAVIYREDALTFSELDRRSNLLAHRLLDMKVRLGDRVAVSVKRSLEIVVAVLGALKAGAAYVPLDPSYPRARQTHMITDSGAIALVTSGRESNEIGGVEEVARISLDALDCARGRAIRPTIPMIAECPSYVIYTSGSTGQPKGVVVTHRNVAQFFEAMDRCLAGKMPGVWLAVTSISFDISVLELMWTLTRGFRVIVQDELGSESDERATPASHKPMDLSLFFFADAGSEEKEKYRLLLESAQFADRHGFRAIWTPERHFHSFGGLYPNPAVTGAAVAAVTRNLEIRAGSVVLPLHDPIRVAEEWSVVDNLSNGRVGISFASGWHADDFVFAPDRYAERKDVMLRGIETTRQLWRGEAVRRRGGAGNEVEVRIHPQPVQAELPVWITAAGNPESFRIAGELGANLLTHLLGQELEELAEKIELYREARRSHGFSPKAGTVTLMLHTFLGVDDESVREKVRGPFTDYLGNSFGLLKNLAKSLGMDENIGSLTKNDLRDLLAHAFERFYVSSGLFGTLDSCRKMLSRVAAIGIDEIGCLIDFGIDFGSTMESLSLLERLNRGLRVESKTSHENVDFSLAAQVSRHQVSHLQCTPSMGTLLSSDRDSLESLSSLEKLLIGGEELPPALLEQLAGSTRAEIFNVYGPTETTIWSLCARVAAKGSLAGRGDVTIGRALLNESVYVLDRRLQPVPVGVGGEVLIGGAGVVPGYWSRPGLTAERFLPDHLGHATGSRLYRTGDLARLRPDGQLDFLGRVDHQIKVRGYRIELGEIEALLRAHPAIREAAVTACGDASDTRGLAAYLVMSPSCLFLHTRLRFRNEKAAANRPLITLPNGLSVAHMGEHQAMAGFREVFEDNEYFRHGISLSDGACVFDVGANIGLFTLSVHDRCRRPKVFAFEPIPPTFDALRANVALYGLDVELFKKGVGRRAGQEDFQFYPHAAGLSGRFAGSAEEREEVRSMALEVLEEASGSGNGSGISGEELEEALGDYLRTDEFRCEMVRISDVIRQYGIDRIDLLKVDVERSECDVLAGIEDEDWQKIDQIVLEIHTRELLDQVTDLIVERGYEVSVEALVVVEKGPDRDGIQVYLAYARRSGLEEAHAGAARVPSTTSVSDLRQYLSEYLPEYMIPAEFVNLEDLPRTGNGKIDRRTLPAPSGLRPHLKAAYVAPQTMEQESIARAWEEVLDREQVGIHDNFFEVGGSSLLLVRLQARLKQDLDRDLRIVHLFRYPTISELARFLSSTEGSSSFEAVEARATMRTKAHQQGKEILRQKLFQEQRRKVRGKRVRPVQ